MKLTDAVYVLTKDDEGAVIAGLVQAVEAPEEEDEHDEEIGRQIEPILARTLAQYRLIHDGHKLKNALWCRVAFFPGFRIRGPGPPIDER